MGTGPPRPHRWGSRDLPARHLPIVPPGFFFPKISFFFFFFLFLPSPIHGLSREGKGLIPSWGANPHLGAPHPSLYGANEGRGWVVMGGICHDMLTPPTPRPPYAADPGTLPPPPPTTTTSIISSLPAWLIGGPVTDSLINSLISARPLPARPQT